MKATFLLLRMPFLLKLHMTFIDNSFHLSEKYFLKDIFTKGSIWLVYFVLLSSPYIQLMQMYLRSTAPPSEHTLTYCNTYTRHRHLLFSVVITSSFLQLLSLPSVLTFWIPQQIQYLAPFLFGFFLWLYYKYPLSPSHFPIFII